ncbi:MAG: hypothetical protein AAF318_05045 [Pseudomonadota bacterium]
MSTHRLKSSIVATALGGAVVFAAVAAGTVALPDEVVTEKSDRLMLPMTVSCTADCAIDGRISAAFDTVAAHDTETGVTTLTRIPAGN